MTGLYVEQVWNMAKKPCFYRRMQTFQPVAAVLFFVDVGVGKDLHSAGDPVGGR